MDQTHTTTGQDPATSSDAIERGKAVYDEIMVEIDSELTHEGLALLAEKYKDETPDQAAVRQQRYDAAFAEYDKRYAQYMSNLNGQVKGLQRTVRAGIENDERTVEANELANLESSFSQA
jgi:hypothetical protein